MIPIPRTPCRRGVTLLEVLIVVVILAAIAAIALPLYFRALERARSGEAATNLAAIRNAELMYQGRRGTFVEAIDLPSINAQLDLELSARHFDYEVQQADRNQFLIVATSREAAPGGAESLRVTMDHTGKIAYNRDWGTGAGGGPLIGGGAGAGGSGGGGGRGGSGAGGGSSGSQGGAATGGGTTAGGSGGDATGGGDGGGASGGDSGGSGGDGGGAGGGGARVFTYIARGADIWTDWPNSNALNIEGTLGVDTLTQTFNAVANSGARAITDDMFRRGISISFSNPGAFPCGGAIACFIAFRGPAPPAAPDPLPLILFNPDFLGESPAVLGSVLAHEGTHFQQYLDGRLLNPNLGTVDIEFDAFWNEAVYWSEVRATLEPFDTPLEQEADFVYQLAQQGEGALRDRIAAVYCGGLPNC